MPKPLIISEPPSRAEQCAGAIREATRELDDLTVTRTHQSASVHLRRIKISELLELYFGSSAVSSLPPQPTTEVSTR